MTTYIGIDPGKQGAIAILRPRQSRPWMDIFDLPYNGPDVDVRWLWMLLDQENQRGSGLVAVIERQIPLPVFRKMRGGEPVLGDDGEPQMMRPGAKSTFEMGKNYGALWALLRLSCASVDDPTPSAWKKVFGLSSNKAASMAMAEKLFVGAELRGPRGGALDGRAEALLLAHYGRSVTYQTGPAKLPGRVVVSSSA